MRLLFLAATVLLLGTPTIANKYKVGDQLTLYANKVGPFHNPTETYQFFNLPFCQPPGGKQYKIEDLGEVREVVGNCQCIFSLFM